MSKSEDPKMRVTQYHATLHYGICHGPVDYMMAIYAQEKLAWGGYQVVQDQLTIRKKELFGGTKKEGGLEGLVEYLPGDSAQTIPTVLASKLGLTTATCPAYRGITSAWFYGRKYVEDRSDSDGFMWGANNPYLPSVWIKVARAAVGLNDDYARIWRYATGDPVDTQTIDLNAVTNAATTPAGGLTAGVTINTTGNLRLEFSLPAGETYASWSPWGDPVLSGPDSGTISLFSVIRDEDITDVTLFGAAGPYNGYEAARAAFPGGNIRGGQLYTFYLQDSPVADNTGGISVKVDFYEGDEFDANPAHIIYECLTNVAWGMGSPASAIDVDSFEDAAVVLYNEGLGLSMIWTKQSSIESFVNEVLDHIEATLFVSPLTGLLTLKLIRDDYSLTGLPEFTPDNSVVTKFSRKLWGETINEIIVTWTNPENEQEETVIAQDLANISTQGGIVSDGRNYYGVRSKELAMQLAHRDLRAASTPLASCDIEVSREGWSLLPGDVVVLNSPEDDIVDLVMRVGPVDYGRIGDAKIRASLVEDVFALGLAEYSVPPDGAAEEQSEEPTSADNWLIFTLPYYWVVTEIAPTVTPEYPEVYAGVFASEEGFDSFDYELLGEVTDTLGTVTFEQIGTKNVVSRALLAEAISAEINTVVVSYPDRTQGPGPQVAGFMLIEGTDETDTELCLILSYSSTSDSYTLSRGILDTVPRSWPAGTPVWFVNNNMTFADTIARSDAEEVNYKQLIRTSLGALDEADAPTITGTLTGRPHYPLRPANVLVNSNPGFSDVVDLSGVDPIPTSWARRNRTTEDAIILAWDDADVTPEASQTTTVRLLDIAGATLHEYTGIAGTSQDVDPADFAGEDAGYIEFVAVRDGYESLQGYRVAVALTFGVMEFEDGEFYEFEDVSSGEVAVKIFED